MASLPVQRYTPEQYLAMERAADFKSEYLYGEIFAMAGNTREHVLIVANLSRSLGNALHGKPCETYPTDMRVKVTEAAYPYPDIAVACGEPLFLDGQFDTLLNPTVIVEVLSKSTEAYDRGEKFALYRGLASLQQYVLVSQDRVRVEWFTRQTDGHWLLSEAAQLEDSLALPALDCAIPLSEIYDRVTFEDKEAEAAS